MKILFTSKGTDWDAQIDPRFGRTDYFFVYDEDKDAVQTYDNREIANVAHGAGPKTAQKIVEYDVDVIVTGNGPGGNAASVISQIGVKIFVGASNMTIKEAYEQFSKNALKLV